MDDFERAVIISFDLSGSVDASLKERANAFISEIKTSPEVWKLCLERFSVSTYSEVKFWCLQTLLEVIRGAFPSLHRSERDLIKTALLTWVTRDGNNSQLPLPPFLRNKVAQTLVAVLQHEYPDVWPGFFQDLLRAVLPGSQLGVAGVGGQPSGTLGPVLPGNEGLVDMWCRILVSVDEDLVTLDIPRSQDESKLSMHVKDSMREHSIADIAAAWQVMVQAYSSKAPELAAMVLGTMQRYISWIDIGLVADTKFVSLLLGLVDSPGTALTLRGAAADCLAEMVTKRMDAVPKLTLVQAMGIVPRCAAWAAGFPQPSAVRRASGASGQRVAPAAELDPEEEDLLLRLAKLLAALAGEVMDVLKRVENGVISLTALGLGVSDDAAAEAGSAAQRASELLDQLFPAVLSAFRSEVDQLAMPLLPFMSSYVARLKTLQKRSAGLPASAISHVHAIFDGIAACARYPRDSAFALDAGLLQGGAAPGQGPPGRSLLPQAAKDEQAEVEEKRRDLSVLFRNLAKTVYPEALTFLGRLLEAAITQPADWQDVEIALALLYEVGEAGLEDMGKADCGALAPLVTALAQSVTAAGAGGGAGGAPGSRGSSTGAPPANGGPVVPQQILALPASGHPLIALAVLEIFVRYSRVLNQAPALLPGVLLAYLDGRGMAHPLEEVSTRACYLFSRLSKSLRTALRPFLGSMLPSLHPVLARVLTTPIFDTPTNQIVRDSASKALAPTNAVVDDRLYVFEGVGLMLGQEDVPAEQQAAALAALLQPLNSQIQANLRSAPGGPASGPGGPGMIVQALEAVMRLSKGFKTDLLTRQRPQLGMMFAGVLESSLAVPQQYPAHRLLRSRFISFVHRLVEALQAVVLPYLPTALEALVMGPQSEASDLTEVLALVNQLVVRFKEGLAPLMEGLLPVVVPRVAALLGPGWDWSGRAASPQTVLLVPASGAASAQGPAGAQPAANGSVAAGGAARAESGVTATLEEARERGELQRAYYGLLHSVAHHGLSGALLKADPGAVLEPVMAALTRGAASHVDPATRRICVQVFSRLITEWVSSGHAEAIPGFKRYAMEHLGGEACVLGVLRSQPPLDPRDGGTVALLQDLASALKLVYERCSDDFAHHLLEVVCPAAGLPPPLAQQLVAHVRLSETREVRDALRSLLVQSQQGGGRSGAGK